MPRQLQHVPYGYEPPAERQKGTLVYYDTFEHTTETELETAALVAQKRAFAKLVLYPLHEETVRRMFKEPVSSLYKREDRLHDWKRHSGRHHVMVENLEGKRKKYTPVDSALRHLEEKYESPLFLYVTPEMANAIASYSTFEEWIKKIRLLIIPPFETLHPRLEAYSHRWSWSDV
ncbi:hypothetical protein Q5741_04255 [Paenibacillus sp. JX-17]|uniref:Uncharacterized protein n=1 Tax=Paenibacillus lacisoli TaxID=3064525 RepID=A0ABT9CDF0_9BACL|nr:hypothetical protein [Paenibacillus sp. JX-17]MDO7905623.1 hypothetical protein [Paenibacillus sp. JX-17]